MKYFYSNFYTIKITLAKINFQTQIKPGGLELFNCYMQDHPYQT